MFTTLLENKIVFGGVVYLAIINIIAFLLFGLDKWSAQAGWWRTREKTLWILAALGGSLGMLLGMQMFRHKTKKASFQLVFIAILLIQIVTIATVLWLLNESVIAYA